MKLKKLVYSSVFLCIGMILPLLTSQIKEIGDSLLPMHIPVMLCGFIAGPWYGLAVGFILPFLRSAVFSMPPMYPNAVWMAFELATYGFMCGLLYNIRKKQGLPYIYLCLIASMLCGRIVWGIAKTLLLMGKSAFTLQAFWIGGFIDAIPGIILQLVLIPIIVKRVKKL